MMKDGQIVLRVDDTEWIRLEANGDFYIRGRLATNDQELVTAFRGWLASARDSATEALRAATSFSLGHESDIDTRPYVSVSLRYGSIAYPIMPWGAAVVDHTRGLLLETEQTFDTQESALRAGFEMLRQIR